MTSDFSENPLTESSAAPARDLPPVTSEISAPVYAGFLRRFIALAIDFTIISIFFYSTCVAAIFSYRQAYSSDPSSTVFFILFSILFYHVMAFAYFVYFIANGGQTPGKMALGIKVIGQTGQDVGLVRSLFRAVGYFISSTFFMAGFLWALIDDRRQTWHDKLAGTVVLEI